MQPTTRTRYLVPTLFTCGMLSLTTGIVAAVQQNKPTTETQPPDQKSLPTPSLTFRSDIICYDPNKTAKPDKENAIGPHTGEALQKDIEHTRAWLSLFDQGQYDACYRQLASSVQSAYSREEWKASRKNIGKPVSRQYASMDYLMGVHKTIRFDTVSADNQRMIETVTLLKQNDGSWKIAHYDLEKKNA